jgi:predicted amidohydrolase
MKAVNDVVLVDRLRIGLMQTSLDHGAAWVGGPKMSRAEEDRAISEITKFISGFKQENPSPEIILLPELAVPRGFIPTLRRMAKSLSAVIIAGLDYREVASASTPEVANEAIIIVPDRWMNRKISAKTTVRYIGKTYPSKQEEKQLLVGGVGFQGDRSIWIFDGGEIGRFGVAICYDFLDLERVSAYREQIQHLFVLSYNRDTSSFDHAAEALSRMIFCNVVVCNTGFFGGSLAVSPYYRPQRRTIYRHSGAELVTSQVIELPVKSLWEHQQGKGDPAGGETSFKGLPAGYNAPVTHVVKPVTV